MSRNVRKISAQSESLQRSNIDMEQRLVEVKKLFEKEKSKREKEALNWASSAGLGDGSLAQTRAVKNSRSKGALDSQSRKILGKGYDRKRWLLFCVQNFAFFRNNSRLFFYSRVFTLSQEISNSKFSKTSP